MSNSPKDKNEKLLISVNRGYEADMVKGCLRTENIPFYTKEHSGPAGFARFDNKYDKGDIEFYVPEDMLDKAKAVLPPVTGAEEIQKELADKESAAEDVNEDIKKAENKETGEEKAPESKSKRILFTLLFLILIVIVIFGVDAVMNWVRAAMGWA